MNRDNLFRHRRSPVTPFKFDEKVAEVFDDMLQRSIPLYGELIARQAQLIGRFYQSGTRVYDLGCSNGNLGMAVLRHMGGRPFQMIAVDNARPMLDAYQDRLDQISSRGKVALHCADINDTAIENASVVVLNFTLQFLPVNQRDRLVKRICDGLAAGGVLLFSEKVTHDDEELKQLQLDVYHGFKRENGYSELEISQKREALETVLIPETVEQHLHRLHQAGFPHVDVWLKWFNFMALIAIK